MNLPVEHLSASSLTRHMKCPRQWQEHYMFGRREQATSSLVIGSAVHLALHRLNSGQEVGNYWNETVQQAMAEGGIDWKKDTPDLAENIARAMVYHYWEMVGRHLPYGGSELESMHDVPGIPIPIKMIVDKVTDDRIVDYKTTAYFSRKQVRPNKEWKVQQAIYQLKYQRPSEIHVLTRAKTDPVVVPSSQRDPLYFGRFNDNKTEKMVRDEYRRMVYHLETYGEKPWPGSGLHEYADKYCTVEDCCAL